MFVVKIYAVRHDTDNSPPLVRAYPTFEEAAQVAFAESRWLLVGSSVFIDEVPTDGEPIRSNSYVLDRDEIYLLDEKNERTRVVATRNSGTDLSALATDESQLADCMKDNNVRIAIVRSLLNIEATQKGYPSSMGTSMLIGAYEPLSKNKEYMSQGTYHQMVKNDITELHGLNEHLASWIQDLLDLTGYKESVAGLAKLKPFRVADYEPTVVFPADLKALGLDILPR